MRLAPWSVGELGWSVGGLIWCVGELGQSGC